MDKNLLEFKKNYDLFSDIPIDDRECILHRFLKFEIGTHRESVWRWFESNYSINIGEYLYKIVDKFN
jgi:hypothetical protein